MRLWDFLLWSLSTVRDVDLWKEELVVGIRGRFRLLTTGCNIGDETKQGADFHSEMEGRLRMNW